MAATPPSRTTAHSDSRRPSPVDCSLCTLARINLSSESTCFSPCPLTLTGSYPYALSMSHLQNLPPTFSLFYSMSITCTLHMHQNMLHLDTYLTEQTSTRLRQAWAVTPANQIIIPNSDTGKPEEFAWISFVFVFSPCATTAANQTIILNSAEKAWRGCVNRPRL